MAYDEGYPTSSDQVSAAILRENFLAIFEGRVNYEKSTLSNSSPPGSGTTDTFLLYGKDANSKAELHGMDEDSNEIQMTSAGSLGSTATNIKFESLTHDGTRSFGENNFIAAWALISHNGGSPTVTLGSGIASATVPVSSATYTINIDANRMANANYGVMATPVGTGEMFVDSTFTRTVTQCKVTRSLIGAATAGDFFIFLIGGQT